jgi:hypothetical protein
VGADPATRPLAVHVAADGGIWIDVGSRLVELAGPEELERILDRLAADGGGIHLSCDPGRADDDDEPASRVADAGDESAGIVAALARERGIEVMDTGTDPRG